VSGGTCVEFRVFVEQLVTMESDGHGMQLVQTCRAGQVSNHLSGRSVHRYEFTVHSNGYD